MARRVIITNLVNLNISELCWHYIHKSKYTLSPIIIPCYCI